MANTIQHLRASRAVWAQHDIIPKDGELALLRTEDGASLIKIGDGIHHFSELSAVAGEALKGSGSTHLLRHGEDTHFGSLESLSLSLPQNMREDYYSMISFDSPEQAPTELVYPEVPRIYFSGDDVIDGIFIPEAGRHYTLLFWYDGKIQGLSRGVTLASE
jgi:hypothetical protein